MEDECVHDHIEDHGEYGLSLVHTEVSLEEGSIVTPGPGYHGNTAPVRLENTERLGAYPVSRENFETPVPFQGAILLLEVQKYLVYDCLPHGRELM